MKQKLVQAQELIWMTIFVQGMLAILGSLYYSTFGDPVANVVAGNLFPIGQGLEPCLLCWLARILMFPIALISYVGILKKDRRFTDYLIPLVVLGIPLELYHYAIQMLPIHNWIGCSVENPCNVVDVSYFGFLTIPLLCLVAFVVLGALIAGNMWINKKLEEK